MLLQNITADLGHKIEDSGTTKIKALLKELLPQSGQGDGFYYCRIMKSA